MTANFFFLSVNQLSLNESPENQYCNQNLSDKLAANERNTSHYSQCRVTVIHVVSSVTIFGSGGGGGREREN